jgi:aspartate/methionine/tyrosine aminotransferase
LQQSRFSLASRLQNVSPFRVMTVLQRAKALEAQGRSIIHLEVGEPDFVTAAPILEAGRRALAEGRTAYTSAAGIPELRELIAQHYLHQYQVSVAPERIFVTPGASGGLSLVAQMLLNPEDAVLMPDPGYPCNRNYVRLAGAEAQLVPVRPDTNYQLTPALLDSHYTPATRGVWVASPGNPTGTVLGLKELADIAQWCDSHDCHLLVDEIYHGLDYTHGLPTVLQVCPDAIVVNSFSKYFGMTGWRLGWLVVPEALVAATNILAQNLFIAASTVAQYAALQAFAEDTRQILEERRQAFSQRRDFLTQVLIDLGFTVPVPTLGAFYIYAGIEKFSSDSEQFCHQLLEQFGVAVTPGTDFGDFESRSHVRFAFTTGMEELEVAAQRLREAVGSGLLSS